MTRSRSTPRVRFVQTLYAAVIVLAGLSDGHTLAGFAGSLAQIAGLMLVGIGSLGRVWTSLFIAGRKDRELVTDGPYAACRNPLYLLSAVAALGIGLASRSLVLTCLLPLTLCVTFWRVVRAEEALLAHRHGADFTAYATAVPRFWPDRSPLQRRGEVVVPTAIYFKAFLDAASFLLLYCLVVAADLMARSGLTPILLELP